jgi:hypothetical protein
LLCVPGQQIKEDSKMKMPTQATAVQRTATPTKIVGGITPSDSIACKLCDLLSGPAKIACQLAAC